MRIYIALDYFKRKLDERDGAKSSSTLMPTNIRKNPSFAGDFDGAVEDIETDDVVESEVFNAERDYVEEPEDDEEEVPIQPVSVNKNIQSSSNDVRFDTEEFSTEKNFNADGNEDGEDEAHSRPTSSKKYIRPSINNDVRFGNITAAMYVYLKQLRVYIQNILYDISATQKLLQISNNLSTSQKLLNTSDLPASQKSNLSASQKSLNTSDLPTSQKSNLSASLKSNTSTPQNSDQTTPNSTIELTPSKLITYEEIEDYLSKQFQPFVVANRQKDKSPGTGKDGGI